MSHLSYGMDQLGDELRDEVITFAGGEELFKCPKCGERALRIRRQGFEHVTRDFPQYGKGYFEAQCQECGFGENRDMVVALSDMGTACALVYLYDIADSPL